MLQIKQAVRKPFPIQFEQVTLENIHEVAAWCKGTVEMRPQRMLGTPVELPVIKIKGQGDQRNKFFDATLGCYVVELKGSFRVYKPAQFEASFDVVPSDDDLLSLAEQAVAATTNGSAVLSDLAGLAARESTVAEMANNGFHASGA